MATVPNYDERIGLKPLVSPKRTPDDFTAQSQVAQGLGRVAEQFGYAAIDWQKNENAARVKEALAAAGEVELNLLYNKDVGAINTKGVEAIGDQDNPDIATKTTKDFVDSVNIIRERLGNDSQKQAFDLYMADRKNHISKTLMQHVIKQRKEYIDNQDAAFDARNLNLITKSDDDSEVDTLLDQMVASKLVKYKHESPEFKQQMAEQTVSTAYTHKINNMMMSNASAAMGYYELKKEFITESDRTKLEKSLKPLAAQQDGVNFAAEVYDDETPLTEMTAKARERFKDRPESMHHAIQEIKTRRLERETEKHDTAQEAADAVYTSLAEQTIAGRTPSLRSVPADKWKYLLENDPKIAMQISEHIKLRAQADSDRFERKQREKTNDQMMAVGNLISNPELLRDANLEAMLMKGEINKTQYPDLVKRKKAVLDGTADPAMMQAEKAVISMLKRDLNDGVFGDKESFEAKAEYEKQVEFLRQWRKLNPDKTPADYYDQVMTPVKKGWIGGLLDKVGINVSPSVQDPKSARESIEASMLLKGKPAGRYKVRGSEIQWDGKQVLK